MSRLIFSARLGALTAEDAADINVMGADFATFMDNMSVPMDMDTDDDGTPDAWHYQVLQEQNTVLASPIMGIEGFRDPKNYENSWNWCAGLLYQWLHGLELMVGYQMDFTPIPERTLTLENPSRSQSGISMGVRWQVNDTVRLGLAYVHNWFEIFDVQDSITVPPTNGKGYGSSQAFGLDILWTL